MFPELVTITSYWVKGTHLTESCAAQVIHSNWDMLFVIEEVLSVMKSYSRLNLENAKLQDFQLKSFNVF